MRVLALDASLKSGWAVYEDGKLTASGALTKVDVQDFNVNKDPQLSRFYPYNIVDAAEAVADAAFQLSYETGGKVSWTNPGHDVLVIENTNKGKNRHTQRILEFIHAALLKRFRSVVPIVYMDSSEWRRIVGMKLTKEQQKNNKLVSDGKKKGKKAEVGGKKLGKIGKKHLSVWMVNEKFSKSLLLKDNDEADAILLGLAYVTRSQAQP